MPLLILVTGQPLSGGGEQQPQQEVPNVQDPWKPDKAAIQAMDAAEFKEYKELYEAGLKDAKDLEKMLKDSYETLQRVYEDKFKVGLDLGWIKMRSLIIENVRKYLSELFTMHSEDLVKYSKFLWQYQQTRVLQMSEYYQQVLTIRKGWLEQKARNRGNRA